MEMTNEQATKQIKKMQLLLLMIISFGLGSTLRQSYHWIEPTIFGIIATYVYFKYSLSKEE